MKRIATHEAKTQLSRYLEAVSRGESFIITRGRVPLAKLVPYTEAARPVRPKVGETLDPPAHIPDEVFAPMSREELDAWGL